jgi:hypothetical protein
MKMKKNLTPDELERLRELVEQLRGEVADLLRFVESKLADKPS